MKAPSLYSNVLLRSIDLLSVRVAGFYADFHAVYFVIFHTKPRTEENFDVFDFRVECC